MPEEQAGVYALYSVVSRKWYVGSSLRVLHRVRANFYMLARGKHHNPHLQAAFLKYGMAKFGWVVLETCDPKDRVRLEKSWITCLAAFEHGYNIREPDMVTMAAETRAKISRSMKGVNIWMKGRKLSSVQLNALVAARKSALLTPISRERYRLSKLGRKNPMFKFAGAVRRRVKRLRASGRSYREIGLMTGVSSMQVWNICNLKRRACEL